MTDKRDDDRPFKGVDGLFDLIAALREAAESGGATRRGSVERGDARIDFGYDINTGMGPGAPGRRGHPSLGGKSRGTVDAADIGRDDVPTSVVVDGDDRLVTADLGGASATDVSADVVDGRLVVSTDEATVCEVPLDGAGPWTVADHQTQNGVFEARVVPA